MISFDFDVYIYIICIYIALAIYWQGLKDFALHSIIGNVIIYNI